MDSKKHLAPSCDTFSTTAPEAQWNLQMYAPTVKQETVECIDEEESACSVNMYPSELLEPSKFVNYYDNKEYVLGQVKKEFPEDECLQSHVSMNGKLVFENMELSNLIDEQQIKQEHSEDGLSLLIKEENDNKMYQVPIKMERLEEHDILHNAEVTSIHYDVLVTPRVVQCKLCGRIFKNSFNLLKHNNEHIQVEINTPGDNEMIELHQCQYYDKVLKNSDNMLSHVDDVHSNEKPKDKLYGKQLPSTLHPDGNINDTNNDKLAGKEDEEMKYKCDSCARTYKSKYYLTEHVKRKHYDYGRTFPCWCGKQFRTPRHLRVHMRMKHDGNIIDTNNDKFTGKEVGKMKYKCDSCEGTYESKYYLTLHIKRMHYDYGRTFQCWCGEQFRTPFHLREHKRKRHVAKNEVYKCTYCEAVFNVKRSLTGHIKRKHYDYGRTFECWCGKQFRTPIDLRRHMRRQHDGNINGTNNDQVTGKAVQKMKYKCDSCESTYESKYYLTEHIKSKHYDYGKAFECWCGKQFRTPHYLRMHMRRQHDGNMNGTNNDKLTGKEVEKMKYKCDSCEGTYKNKYSLTAHIKSMHYDYGKAFECWCGKQFRTPHYLRIHIRRQHDGNINGTSNDKLTGKEVEKMKYKCDSCEGTYKNKHSLTQHIKCMHYDYGRTFDCWCGKQFRSPEYLRMHIRRQHNGNINGTNNGKLTGEEVEKLKYKCDSCEGTYKNKDCLTAHIKKVHYDYGRTFECCGKQFRSPIYLRKHMRRQHDGKIKDRDNGKVRSQILFIE